MTLPRPRFLTLVLLLCLLSAPARADEHDFFEQRIRPVLVETCLPCHGGKETESNFEVTSRAVLLAGGDRGAAIVPGDSQASLLLQAIRHEDEQLAMPPGKSLPDQVVADFEHWIKSGAPWPDSMSLSDLSHEKQQAHWAFQPLTRPIVPTVKSGWASCDIDTFVLKKLEQYGLTPNELADRPTLLRRAAFDLTGLPPEPDLLRRILSDPAPNAFEKVVDELLASPAYGERFGRLWLDVVRYADTAGNPPDFPVPQARRYRDYVIDAFASDKPFDQFVREQIAGDLLEATSDEQRQQQIIATGYLAIGRRYFGTTSGADHLEVEDLIQTLGTSMLGLSLGCCRCHDHKFDPISQQEYYALYGIISSTRYPQPGREGSAKQENFVMLPDGSDAYAVTEGTGANAYLHLGGDPGNRGADIPRGFLKILGNQQLTADVQGSGRHQLAEWLTDHQRNPLLARVIVNRVWQHLFGAGLVTTPNDFGLRGSPPSHPELLDHLALQLIADGWSIKKLCRRIMLSRTYQLSSTNNATNAVQDPANRWLWRHARRRLDAESIRDSLLAVSGTLDHSRGGEHPFPPREQWAFSQHAPFMGVYDSNRRSVYLMQQRLKRHPLLSMFDGADPNFSTASRAVTTTPIQSLFWMNDPFVHEQSERLAARLLQLRDHDHDRIHMLHELLFSHAATESEVTAYREYLTKYGAELRSQGVAPSNELAMCWASLARVLFASNEFIYID